MQAATKYHRELRTPQKTSVSPDSHMTRKRKMLDEITHGKDLKQVAFEFKMTSAELRGWLNHVGLKY